eukprot:UN16693
MGVNGWGFCCVGDKCVMDGSKHIQGMYFIWYNSYIHISSHYEKIIFENFENCELFLRAFVLSMVNND